MSSLFSFHLFVILRRLEGIYIFYENPTVEVDAAFSFIYTVRCCPSPSFTLQNNVDMLSYGNTEICRFADHFRTVPGMEDMDMDQLEFEWKTFKVRLLLSQFMTLIFVHMRIVQFN